MKLQLPKAGDYWKWSDGVGFNMNKIHSVINNIHLSISEFGTPVNIKSNIIYKYFIHNKYKRSN